MKRNLLLFFILFLCSTGLWAQKTVSGIVTDTGGEPLIGANVLVVNTSIGTITDIDGSYSVEVPEGATSLEVSYIGYPTKVVDVTNGSTFNIELSEGEVIEEVVVTGVAGAVSRKKLSVTVAKVDGKALETMPTSSAANALQGKVAGVTVTNLGQPGQGANIQLRGAANLFGSQEPLVLIDGVIVEGGLAGINSDDIESFEVVKGASASALYGSRAGNGVIVITTKKGKYGKTEVTLKADYGVSRLNNKVKLSNSHAYELASDYKDYNNYTRYDGIVYPSDYDGVNYADNTGALIESADGYQDNPYGVYNDPQSKFFQTGLDRTLYASISTANDKGHSFFSAETTRNEGIIAETDGYERYSARFNNSFRINDWLKFTTANNYIRSINNTPGGSGSTSGIFFNALKISPDVDLAASNLDGQPYLLVPDQFESNNVNPLYILYKNKREENINRFIGSYTLNVKLNDKFNIDNQYALETYSTEYESYNPYDTYTTGGEKADLYSVYTKGSLYKESLYSLSQKFQTTLNYTDSYGDLNLRGKLSYLLEDFGTRFFYARGREFIYPQGIVSLDNFAPENTFISSNKTNEKAQNYFLILGADYMDRYIFDGMIRRDGSSLFGSDNRWNNYFRLSAAYRLTEDFKIPGVQELKIHTAYGTAGQRPGFNWQYDFVGLSEGQLSTNRIKANPSLRPSTTEELEIGLTSRFANRFDFEAIYSNSSTKDQFMLVDIFAPANNGANRQWQNIGTVDFQTVELSLGANIVNKEDFQWDARAVFEKTTNKISKLNVNPIFVGSDSQDARIFRVEEGLQFGTMYGEVVLTSLDEMAKQLPTGKTIEEYTVNRDGVVVEKALIGTADEKAIIKTNEDGSNYLGPIGNQNPDFKLGLSNTLTYKGFTFYMLWDWKQGGDVYNKTAQWLVRDNRHSMIDQSGYADGDKKTVNYYQSLYNVSKPTSYWVEDASYVKLRELSLFYTLNSSVFDNLTKGFVKSARIGVTGKNLLTFTKYTGWDPEVQSYGSRTDQYYSYDYSAYPVFSTYTLSLQLKF